MSKLAVKKNSCGTAQPIAREMRRFIPQKYLSKSDHNREIGV